MQGCDIDAKGDKAFNDQNLFLEGIVAPIY